MLRSQRSALTLRRAEKVAWVVGLFAVATWAVLWISGRVGARQELARFEAARNVAEAGPTKTNQLRRFPPTATPDFLLWSPQKVTAWRSAQSQGVPLPIGVLRIRRLHVEVPILEGTDDPTLDRAVGHIEGTPAPGSAGNSGIAGHRDSFFRALKDIAAGDTIELATLEGDMVYRVETTWIVDPDDVWVLDPTSAPAITLVTCYPFYYIGSAPQRFIVRAVRSTA